VAVLYAPDVVSIPEQAEAMDGITLYVGDGASVARSIVRRREGMEIGHASIREQLDWCAAEGVRRAIFSHCGSQIVKDEEAAAVRVAALGAERGVEAAIAYDGLELELR
jgi:phosphoribosyl 1,2-cyclic phosphodiesterase